MKKLFLLIPIVVLISGCNEIYSSIDFKYPKDQYGFWSECVMREHLRYKVSNSTLEHAINQQCYREMLVKEINRHAEEQERLEKTVQEATEYLKESKKKASTSPGTDNYATDNGKRYRQMIPGDENSWEEVP